MSYAHKRTQILIFKINIVTFFIIYLKFEMWSDKYNIRVYKVIQDLRKWEENSSVMAEKCHAKDLSFTVK